MMDRRALYCMNCRVIVPIDHVTEKMEHDACSQKVFAIEDIHQASFNITRKSFGWVEPKKKTVIKKEGIFLGKDPWTQTENIFSYRMQKYAKNIKPPTYEIEE